MFIDYGNKYFAPVEPARKDGTPVNRPSRYKKPAKKKKVWKKPTPKWQTMPARKPRVPKGMAPTRGRAESFIPKIARAARPEIQYISRFATKMNPYTRVASYLWDAYDYAYYTEPEVAAHMEMDPGYRCYSYSAPIDVPSVDCGSQYIFKTFSGGSTACTVWHSQNQATNNANVVNPNHNGLAFGPLRGGAFACERYNLAHVWIYPTRFGLHAKQPQLVQHKPAFTRARPIEFFDPYPKEKAEPLPQTKRTPPLKPYEVAAMEHDPAKGPGWYPVKHILGRPLRGQPEKKFVVLKSATGGSVGPIVGGATEALDALNAVWQALPKEYRSKNASPADKAIDLISLCTNWNCA